VLLGFPLALPLFLLHFPALASSLHKSLLFSLPPLFSSLCLSVSSFLHSSQDFCATPSLHFFCIHIRQRPPLRRCCFSAGFTYCKYRRDKLPVLSYKTRTWTVPGPAQPGSTVAGRVLFSPRLQQSLLSLHKPQLSPEFVTCPADFHTGGDWFTPKPSLQLNSRSSLIKM